MRSRKEKILIAALELFANKGYERSSTQSIAKNAGVSEGLIFRHFGSKEGLLTAITSEFDARLEEKIQPILLAKEPKKVLRTLIQFPFSIPEEEYPIWKLIYKLKWSENFEELRAMDLLREKIADTFGELKYEDPMAESQLLENTLDGVFVNILIKGKKDKSIYQLLIKKYEL